MNNEDKITLARENALGMDDYFEFNCIKCGNCCRNRHDILLQPHDLYRIAKHLKMSVPEVIKKYCEVYIGPDSKMPLIRLLPKPYNNVCPFLRKGICSVHQAKPVVCALFPLGRVTAPNGDMLYFSQPVNCSAEKIKVKVKDWIELFNLKETEETAKLWGQVVIKLSMGKRKYKLSPEEEKIVNDMIFSLLYLSYDLEKEFLPQFRKSIELAENYFESISGKSLDKAMKNVKINSGISEILKRTEEKRNENS